MFGVASTWDRARIKLPRAANDSRSWRYLAAGGGFAALLVAAASAGGFSPSECRTDPATLTFRPNVQARMVVANGRACSLWLRSTALSVNDIRLAADAQHGMVSFRGRTGVIYRPIAGFKGEDSFSFLVNARVASDSETAIYRVQVTVR